MIQLVITSLITFISTNIDDFAVLLLLFAHSDNIKTAIKITLGQVIGITLLTIFSLLAASGCAMLPHKYIRLLGFIPIILAIIYIIQNKKTNENTPSSDIHVNTSKYIFISTLILTLSDGGDNIGVYIPVFTYAKNYESIVIFGLFILFSLLWCFAAYRLCKKNVGTIIRKYAHILVPVIFCTIGIAILLSR